MAVTNAKTRGATRLILARQLEHNRFHPRVPGTVATSGGAGFLIDTKHANSIFPNDYFNNWELTDQTAGFTTSVLDFEKSTGRWDFPTAFTAAASDVYETHSPAAWTTGQYNDAIDQAVQAAGHFQAMADKSSEAIAFQRDRSLYPMPSGFNFLHTVSFDKRPTYIARHPSTEAMEGVSLRTGATDNIRLAQSFKVYDTNPGFYLYDVFLLLQKFNAATLSGNLTVRVETDSAGSPSGTLVTGGVASANVDVTSVVAEPTYVRFTFSTSPLLQEDTTYWLVLEGTYTVSATDNIQWLSDYSSVTSGGGSYSDGAGKVYDAAWAALTNQDFIFSVRSTSVQTHKLEARKHWDVERGSTNYLVFTTAGLALLEPYDGAGLFIEGQGRPALPTSDASTLEVPYDYVVARAGLLLISTNMGWMRNHPGVTQLPTLWGNFVSDLERKMSSPIRVGSILVDPL